MREPVKKRPRHAARRTTTAQHTSPPYYGTLPRHITTEHIPAEARSHTKTWQGIPYPNKIQHHISRSDIVGIGVIAVITAIVFYPALSRGFVLGSLDIMNIWPVTHGLFNHVHNKASFDQASQMVPWMTFDWQSIHHGVFPLWNPYTLLGMAQFGNFQSAVLSLPHLVAYLFPLKNAYLVSVFTTMFIAGTGAYVAARVMGVPPAISIAGAVAFEMSGSIGNWAGWPQGEVNAWLGWIVALVILLHRSDRPNRLIVALGVVIAFAVYAGHPESYLFITITIMVTCAVAAWSYRKDIQSISRTALRVAISTILGVLLSAPLLLTGLQLIPLSTRATQGFRQPYSGLPLSAIFDLIAPRYFGTPAAIGHYPAGASWFGPFSFYELSSCVGPVIILLAIYGTIRLWGRPLVRGLAITAIIDFFTIFDFGPVQKLISAIPHARIIGFTRLLMSLDFILVMLAVLGLTQLLRSENKDRYIFFAIAALVGIVLGVLFAISNSSTLSPRYRMIRTTSIEQAIAGYLAVLVAIIAYWLYTHYSEPQVPNLKLAITTLAIVILATEAVLLIPPISQADTFGRSFYPQDSNTTLAEKTVGRSILGAGPPLYDLTTGSHYDAALAKNVSTIPSYTGFVPESNIAYGVNLFAARDPMLPKAYFDSWAHEASIPEKELVPKEIVGPDNIFIPTIADPALARFYGIRYLCVSTYFPGALQVMKEPLKAGLTLVAKGPGFEIIRVAGVHRFTLTTGSVRSVRWQGNNQVTVDTYASKPGKLIARISALPGWHATVNGEPVHAKTTDDVFLTVAAPRGASTITLSYQPGSFYDGLMAAAVGILLIAILLIADLRRQQLTGKR